MFIGKVLQFLHENLQDLACLGDLFGAGIGIGDLEEEVAAIIGRLGLIQGDIPFFALSVPALPEIPGQVHRDPVKPGGNRRLPPERLELPETPEKNLLGQIQGVLGISQKAESEVIDPVLVEEDQLIEGLDVPLPAPLDQFFLLFRLL